MNKEYTVIKENLKISHFVNEVQIAILSDKDSKNIDDVDYKVDVIKRITATEKALNELKKVVQNYEV